MCSTVLVVVIFASATTTTTAVVVVIVVVVVVFVAAVADDDSSVVVAGARAIAADDEDVRKIKETVATNPLVIFFFSFSAAFSKDNLLFCLETLCCATFAFSLQFFLNFFC